jgi:hypothetical protein
MTTMTCPNGHTSGDAEWCDTCGAPMGGSAGAAVAEPSAPGTGEPPRRAAAPPVACPHCGDQNPGDALFCESCGYDFTTGQVPLSAPRAQPDPAPPPDPAVSWVAVVEVDPRWYGLKGALADQPCPPVSSFTVPLNTHTALVGRTSASRGVRPEVALDSDTGVSRRHAQFVRDGALLTVVDLSSTNGTYVVPAGQEPDEAVHPLVPGVPSDLHDGDRIYLGAWTCLTVRVASA